MKSTVLRTEISEVTSMLSQEVDTSLTERKDATGEKNERTVGFLGTIQAGGMWGGKMAGETVNIYRIKRTGIPAQEDPEAGSSGASR